MDLSLMILAQPMVKFANQIKIAAQAGVFLKDIFGHAHVKQLLTVMETALSGICRSCQCPSTKNIVDLDAFCTSESGWNSKCCKCLVNRLSAGNSNFERFRTNNEVGVLPIDLNTFFYSPCNLITSKPCDS